MSDHNKNDKQDENLNPHSVDVPSTGGFTTAQLRALKWMTSIMGILIVICLILLAIGLSRNAEKLADSEDASIITLPASMDIQSISADSDGHLWLYLKGASGEEIQKITKKGKLVKQITIERERP